MSSNARRRLNKVLLLGCLLYAAASAAELRITDAFVRGLPPGQSTTAAFMELHNSWPETIVLTGAQSDVARTIEIHRHSHHNGMMRMERVDKLEIAPGETVSFRPGGYHLMMFGLNRTLNEGEQLSIELVCVDGHRIPVTLPVRSVLNE